MVLVEAVEKSAPGREETPETTVQVKKKLLVYKSCHERGEGGEMGGIPKLVKVDCARFVGVKHSNHHAYSMRIERRPVTVYEGSSQLSFCKLTTSCRNG